MTGPTSDDIGAWLDEIGLEQYRPLFAREAIDADIVHTLTDVDLERLGMPLGHRKRFMHALRERARDPGEAVPVAPGAERRHLTVLFCDMVDSTRLAQRLDPEILRDVMRPFFERCTEIIEEYGGHLARYMGDGVLAYFGFPRAQDDAAERAVRAGCALVDGIGKLAVPGGGTMEVRVGIASGMVVVGDVLGAGAAREEAVIGETPAIAARLQAHAAPGSVLIADATRRLLGRRFTLDSLGSQALKGIDDGVPIWRVAGERALSSRYEATRGATSRRLIGRTKELDLLAARWQRATTGEGGVVEISGVAGVGKSRLVRALRERLRPAQPALMVLQCSAFHTTTALYPVIVGLQRSAGFIPGEPAEKRLERLASLLAQHNVAHELPLFARLLAIPLPASSQPDLTAEQVKQRTFAALVTWLVALAHPRPLLAIVEDAQWADPTTLELLRLCATSIRDEPALLVITHRSEFTPSWDAGTVPLPLPLVGLPPAQAAELAESVAGTTIAPQLLGQICDRTGGVPLFVEELTKAVLEADVPGVGAPVRPGGSAPQAAIPATLQDPLLARLDRPGAMREVAQVAAAIGREFPYELLESVAPVPPAALEAAVAGLERAEILRPVVDATTRSYAFRHGLVQEAAYSTLLHARRRELHGRIGLMLEERFRDVVASQPALLAHHYTEADLPLHAIQWWSRAAEKSRGQAANLEAIDQYGRALDLVSGQPVSAERDRAEMGLREGLAPALYAAMGPGSAEREANFAALHQLCERLGEHAKIVPVLWGQCVVIFARCDLPAAAAKTADYLRSAELAEDPVALAAGHLHLGHIELLRGAVRSGLAHLERALALYRVEYRDRLIDDFAFDLRCFALSTQCLAMQQIGEAEEARRLGELAVAEVTTGGHFVTTAQVLFQVAMACMIGGDVAGVERFAGSLAALAERHEGLYWRSHADQLLGWAMARNGHAADGLARMRQGAGQRERMQGRAWVPQYLVQEAELLAAQGDRTAALQRLDEAESVVNATDHRVSEPEIYRLRGIILAANGAPASEAEAWLRCALTVADGRGQTLWAGFATEALAAHMRPAAE